MNTNTEIDFIYQLHPHGWSTSKFFINYQFYEFLISHHAFSVCPISDFMNVLSKVIKGENEITFFWYDEPGGVKFEISTLKDKRHIIKVQINKFSDYGFDIKDFQELVVFEITKNAFITISYLQLKKIDLLLKDKSYNQDRGKYFPFQEFRNFEKIAKEFLDFKI